jgi:chromosome segregation ATPase
MAVDGSRSRLSPGESLSDEYSDAQCALLNRAREVERFLAAHCESTPCFQLLQTSFSFFKSEVATCCSLRKSLLRHRTNAKLCARLKSQIRSLRALLPGCASLPQMLDRLRATGPRKPLPQLQSELESARERYVSNERIYDELTEQEAEFSIDANPADQGRLAKLRQSVRCLLDERGRLERLLKPPDSDVYDEIHSITSRFERVSALAESLNQSNQLIIERLRKTIMEIEGDIEGLAQFRTNIEKQLDLVQAKIDFLTNPLALPSAGRQSPHLVRYEIIALENEVARLRDQIEMDESETLRAKEEIQATETSILNRKDSLTEAEQKVAELRRRCDEERILIGRITEFETGLRKMKRGLRAVDRDKAKVKGEQMRLEHQLKAKREKCRRVEIENASLRKSIDVVEAEIAAAKQRRQSLTVGGNRMEEFRQALDAFKALRNQFQIGQAASPADVVSFVRKLVAAQSQ